MECAGIGRDAGAPAPAGRARPHAASLASRHPEPAPPAAPVPAPTRPSDRRDTTVTPRWERIPLAEYLAALPVRRRRLRFRVEGDLELPAFAGALWHAVLGPALKHEACTVPPGVCEGCARERECAYPLVFEAAPHRPDGAPLAALARIPGPLVLDTAPWKKRLIGAGTEFSVGFATVGRDRGLADTITSALVRGASSGLGRARCRARCEAVEDLGGLEPVALPTAREALRLRLLTPLRLKKRGAWLHDFELEALARDLSLRVAVLGHYHGGLPWPAPWSEVVSAVGTTSVKESRLWWVDARRYSARQRQVVPLGGLVGDVVLDGVEPPLGLLLRGATVLHAGKATSLGLGELDLARVAAEQP